MKTPTPTSSEPGRAGPTRWLPNVPSRSAAPEAAEAAFLRAAELSSDEAEQAGLTEQAGRMANLAGWNERAVGHFETAIAAHADAGRVVDAARVTGRLGSLLRYSRPGRAGDLPDPRGALASLRSHDRPA